jgi:hypothetical protein
MTPVSIETCKRINELWLKGDKMGAASLVTPEKEWGNIINDEDAQHRLTIYFYALLHHRHLAHAAAIAWSKDIFSLEPKSAKRIWELYNETRQFLVMAGGAVGKSYTGSAIALLDWASDPENTLTRIISVTRGHSKTNMFAQFQQLHRSSIIQLPGEITAQKISTDPTSDRHGIHIIAIPTGENGAGKLRGLHPSPRSKEHPIFGKLTRVRLILDEASECPEGVWKDIPNLLVTLEVGNIDTIKVLGFSNPEDPDSEYGRRCEYPGGWHLYDPDGDEVEWESVRGWRIFRIDPQHTENVEQRKTVCPGMQTYEGYQQAIKESGGINSAGYWIMCRGMFPPKGSEHSVIPSDIIERCKGEWQFIGPAEQLISVDTALQGGDSTEMTFARYGLATHAKINKEIIKMWDKPRYVIQLDYQLQLEKGDSVQVARRILKEIPTKFNSTYLAIDGTGTGDGVSAILRDALGDILIIIYSNKASDEPIFQDDDLIASECYINVVAEMWWSMRRYLEHKLLLISSQCSDDLIRQLKGRRGKLVGKKYKIEPKDEFKKRFKGKSPDKADSAIQIVHLIRQRGSHVAGVFEDTEVAKDVEFDTEVSYGSTWEMPDTLED